MTAALGEVETPFVGAIIGDEEVNGCVSLTGEGTSKNGFRETGREGAACSRGES